MSSQPITVVGHRGAAGEAPENTLGSFALAVEQGADAIELDVHLSSDEQIIVCHDVTIDRTTNGTGNIGMLTANQLKTADAGSWFHEKYAGERLPTLEEVFDLLPAHVEVNVEIKSDSPSLRRRLIGMMNERSLFDRVFVSSFNHRCLVLLKEAEPRVKIGLLYHKEPLEPAQSLKQYGVELYSLHPHHGLVHKEFVDEAKRLGMKVFPWTVNEEARMREMIEAGVSGIITDYPGRLRSLLES